METTKAVAKPSGENPFLQAFVLEHGSALLTYTERLLKDRHAAEDIVQETLIRAWRHADRLSDRKGSVRGWLLTVARNLVIDRMRSAACRREWTGTADHDAAQPDHADAVVTSIDAKTLLCQLSNEHRQVLQHIYLSDKTVGETARILGIPAGTVKSRQHYALSRLRARLSCSPQTEVAPSR